MPLKHYDHIARLYDILDLPFEYRRYRPLRQKLFHKMHGDLLDAGLELLEERFLNKDIIKLLSMCPKTN